MVPVGQECLCCEMVRHKFWADWDQKALNTLLEHYSDEKDTHAEARQAKVCSDKKYKAKEDMPPTEATGWCATCEQGSNEVDRDAPPRERN